MFGVPRPESGCARRVPGGVAGARSPRTSGGRRPERQKEKQIPAQEWTAARTGRPGSIRTGSPSLISIPGESATLRGWIDDTTAILTELSTRRAGSSC